MSKKLLIKINSIFREEVSKKNQWNNDELIVMVNDVINQAYLESKKKESNKLFPRMMDVYHDFFLNKVGVKPKINAMAGKKMNSIIKYLSENVKNKELGDDAILESWEFILNNIQGWSPFHQGQLKLEQIDSNLPNILNEIRNGSTRKPNGIAKSFVEQTTDVLEALSEYRRANNSNTDAGKHISQ